MRNHTVNYLVLRQFIGSLGILLPFLLVFGNRCFNAAWVQPSISHYYYSHMHFLFVGVLCLIAGFLITYRGMESFDNRVSNIAGICALGVAVFPTGFEGFISEDTCYLTLHAWPSYFSYLHYGSAVCLFVCFALFCFKIFTLDDNNRSNSQFDAKKLRRNRFYRLCGWGIVLSMAAIGGITLYNHLNHSNVFPKATFYFETTSLLFFGNSWLLKGSLDWPQSKFYLKRLMAQPFR